MYVYIYIYTCYTHAHPYMFSIRKASHLGFLDSCRIPRAAWSTIWAEGAVWWPFGHQFWKRWLTGPKSGRWYHCRWFSYVYCRKVVSVLFLKSRWHWSKDEGYSALKSRKQKLTRHLFVPSGLKIPSIRSDPTSVSLGDNPPALRDLLSYLDLAMQSARWDGDGWGSPTSPEFWFIFRYFQLSSGEWRELRIASWVIIFPTYALVTT